MTEAAEGFRMILAGLHDVGEALGSGAPAKLLLALLDAFRSDHRALALMMELAGNGFDDWSRSLSEIGDEAGTSKQAVQQHNRKVAAKLRETHPVLSELILHRGHTPESKESL